jgi:hypothetical protein
VNKQFKIFAVVAAMALVVPAAALANKPEDPGSKGKGKKAPAVKLVTANVFGEVTANNGSSMTVFVSKASGQAKACKGKSLVFDVSTAKVHSADNVADGEATAADVLVGHKVKVRGKVTLTKGKKLTCAQEAETTVAKAVHNRTTPKPEEGEEDAEVTPAS